MGHHPGLPGGFVSRQDRLWRTVKGLQKIALVFGRPGENMRGGLGHRFLSSSQRTFPQHPNIPTRVSIAEARCVGKPDVMTGVKFERNELDEAFAYVRPGNTFVVWKLDRLARSRNLIKVLDLLQERSVAFISLTEKIDTTTPCGKLIFTSWEPWQNLSVPSFVSARMQGEQWPAREGKLMDDHESSKRAGKWYRLRIASDYSSIRAVCCVPISI